MGKSYIATTTITPRIVKSASPIDVRSVVDTYNDLFLNTTFKVDSGYYTYLGMVVTTKDTGDVYVLTKKPNATQNKDAAKYAANIEWKKIGGSDIDPSDFGAKVVDDLDGITDTYEGQFAVVSGSSEEDGLYVYHNSIWVKITTGSSTTEYNSMITTDGSTPENGNGFSIDPDAEDAYVEEVYLDNTTEVLSANVYYTGRGFSSSIKGGNLDGENYSSIELSNNSDSYISFYSYDDSSDSEVNNWIKLHIVDESLGFSKSQVHYIENGEEKTMTNDDLILPCESAIKFDINVNLNGLTEIRGKDGQPEMNGRTLKTYVFGSTGSTYEDLDIYVSHILPTVYAYADGNTVKVLTEGDKEELINIIGESSSSISIEDIEAMFNEIKEN